MKKRLISFVVSLSMVLGLFGVFTGSVSGETEYTDGYYTYTVSEGNATITKVDTAISGDVTIPYELGGYSVTELGSNAFYLCTSIKSITVPNSVTKVYSDAFSDCYSLESVTFSAGCVWVEDMAFTNCYALKEINATDNDGVTSVDGVLFNKDKTELIRYPTGKTDTVYVIPDTVTRICESAFEFSNNLISISVPESVAVIGVRALSCCNQLSEITVDDKNAQYCTADGVLFDKSKSELIQYPRQKTDTCYEIPDTVSRVSKRAFRNCDNLAGVKIPDSVTEIDEQAFYNCDSLTEIRIPAVNEICYEAFSTCLNLSAVSFADGVGHIGEGAFSDCDKLKNVVIPKSAIVGNKAFYSCDGLTGISIGSQVGEIGENAFGYCKNLTDVTIDSGIELIGKGAFSDCSALTSVTIPDSVTEIGDEAFVRCMALTDINVNETNPSFSSVDGVIFNKDKTELILYPTGKTASSYVIPDGVTVIGKDAFSYCNALQSIKFADSVKEIGDYAFSHCRGIEVIEIPDNVAIIGMGLFSNCGNLYEVIIPDNVKEIGKLAFYNCARLAGVFIGDGVSRICMSAFDGCEALKEAIYNGSKSDWRRIRIDPYNDPITNANINYLKNDTDSPTNRPSSGGGGCITDILNESITVNSNGVAYLRFLLEDMELDPYADKTVKYSVDGYDFTGTAKTDSRGIAMVKTPKLSGSGDTVTLTVRFDDEELYNKVFTADVYIKDLSFSQEWQGKINVGTGVSATFGENGAIGLADSEAKLTSIGADVKSLRGLSLKSSYDDGVRSLTLASNISVDTPDDNKLGIFKDADFDDVKRADITMGDTAGNVLTGGNYELALDIEDYDPENEEHITQIAFFLLDSMSQLSGSNALIRSILDAIDITAYNEKTVSTAVQLTDGASINVTDQGASETLAGVGEQTVWSYKAKTDKDGKNNYNSRITTDSAFSLGNASIKVMDNDAGRITRPIINNRIEFSATESGEGLENFEIRTLSENTNNSISWQTDNTDYNEVFRYSGDNAQIVMTTSDELNSFAIGEKGLFSAKSMSDITQSVINSGANADYKKEKAGTKGIDEFFDIGLASAFGFKLGIGFSGIESVSYDTEDGITEGGELYIQSQSDIDSAVDNEKLAFTEIFREPMGRISNAIADTLKTVSGKATDGVASGAATVKGLFDGLVKIVSARDTASVASYKMLAVADDTASLATSAVASTVGGAYIVQAQTESGEGVTDLEAGDITLELSYDSDMLANAGVSDDASSLEKLGLYLWDDEKSVYVNAGGTLDYEDSKVVSDITKSGQYILAYDNCAPSVTHFAASDYSATPVITAEVADLSGISEFELKIDGNTVVDTASFEDYYTYSTAVFKYSIANPLADGEHTATIYATDTSGNKILMPAELKLTVDTTAPVISDVVIPAEVMDGSLEVSANIADSDVSVVNAYIKAEDKTYCYPMTNSDGLWQTNIDNLPDADRLEVYLAAFDNLGNRSQSEITIIDIIKLIKGDAMKDGKINNLDSIRIAQFLAWGIKLSDYELKAADVNDDKRVNNLDLIKLAQKLAGWTIEW